MEIKALMLLLLIWPIVRDSKTVVLVVGEMKKLIMN